MGFWRVASQLPWKILKWGLIWGLVSRIWVSRLLPLGWGDLRKTALETRDMGARLLLLDASLTPCARSSGCPASVPYIGIHLRLQLENSAFV